MAPVQVNSTIENEILNKVFRINNSKIKFKFKVGDKVRISKVKRTFEKGYTPNWSEQYFLIADRLDRTPPFYILKDQLEDPIKGLFYEKEIEKIQAESDDLFVIENIIKTRKNNNN